MKLPGAVAQNTANTSNCAGPDEVVRLPISFRSAGSDQLSQLGIGHASLARMTQRRSCHADLFEHGRRADRGFRACLRHLQDRRRGDACFPVSFRGGFHGGQGDLNGSFRPFQAQPQQERAEECDQSEDHDNDDLHSHGHLRHSRIIGALRHGRHASCDEHSAEHEQEKADYGRYRAHQPMGRPLVLSLRTHAQRLQRIGGSFNR